MNGNDEFDSNSELQTDYTEELVLRIHHYLVNLREERMTDQQSLRQDMHVQFELNQTASQLVADYSTDFEPSDVLFCLEPLFRSFSDLSYSVKIVVVELFSVGLCVQHFRQIVQHCFGGYC